MRLHISGNERGLFRLDKRTGNLTVSGILDREKDSMFKLKIKAFEIRQPESFDTAELKVREMKSNLCCIETTVDYYDNTNQF